MKKYLRNFILISVLFLLTLIVFELLMLLVPNRYSYKYNYVKDHADDIEILLLGNCHIEDDINPEQIGSKAFNMAISGRDEVYDKELAKQFVPQMRNLKAVIMQLDYRSFGFGREKRNPRDYKKHGCFESTYKCMYKKYMKLGVDSWWYWSEIINSELNYKERIWMDKKDAIECALSGFVQLMDSAKNETWQYWDLPRIYDITISVDQEKYEKLYECYHTIAELTAAKNVRLILLGTPMLKTYQEDMVPEVEEEIRAFVVRLQKAFPNVEYYDYTRDSLFIPEDFHDASHLGESGTVKFSKIVRNIINNTYEEVSH